jgi:hypothetical protein
LILATSGRIILLLPKDRSSSDFYPGINRQF